MGRWPSLRDSRFCTHLLAREQVEVQLKTELPAAPPSTQESVEPRDELTKQENSVVGRSAGFSWVASSPAFLRLWLAQILSQTALNTTTYGLIILVAKQSGSVTATAVTIVAFTLPVVLWSLPAGVLIDRLDRRQILWVSNFLRAVGSFLCVTALLIDHTALLPLYVLAFSMASIGAFFAPAEGAMIPSLVPPKHLMSALALFNITLTLAQAIGLILLGPLILHWMPPLSLSLIHQGLVILPVESLFLIITLLYFLCTSLTLSLPRQRPSLYQLTERSARKGKYQRIAKTTTWHSLAESWSFIHQHRLLGAAVWQLTLGGVITAIITLLAPSFTVQFLRQPPDLAGLIFLPAGIGFVLGSLLVPRIVQRLQYIPTVIGGLMTIAGSLVLLTLVFLNAGHVQLGSSWQNWPHIVVLLLITFLMGLALDCVTLPAQTRMQEHAPEWLRGRVLSLQQWWLNALMVPAVLGVGQLVDRIGLVPTLEIVAFMIVSGGLSSLYYGRSGKRSYKDDPCGGDQQSLQLSLPVQSKIPVCVGEHGREAL